MHAETIRRYAEQYVKHINLPFLIYARVDTVTEAKVRMLKAMGCRTFAMGVESGSERLRKKILFRNISNEEIIESFRLVKSFGIRVSAYNMIGFPTETRAEIFETIAINKKIGADAFSVTILEPYKGTPIRKMCEDDGLDPAYETTWNKVQYVPSGMTSVELAGLHRTFPLYVRFDPSRYDDIRLAEEDDDAFKKLMAEHLGLVNPP